MYITIAHFEVTLLSLIAGLTANMDMDSCIIYSTLGECFVDMDSDQVSLENTPCLFHNEDFGVHILVAMDCKSPLVIVDSDQGL